MSVETVRRLFREKGIENEIVEFEQSSATVDLAAQRLGVAPGLIAKTLAVWAGDTPLVIVVRGDAKLDNRKFKDTFKAKARMLGPAEVEEITGHAVGGVCPFALRTPVDVYLDISLQAFEHVYPAAGGDNTAVRFTPTSLRDVTGATWVDVCKVPDND
ncbi:MAG: YbaK/EbsC family protein [Gaiellales bacterium]|nr:YbaK/EbsC family protein [Gaiellales bacterium]